MPTITFEMDSLYWAWLVNEWRVQRVHHVPGWTVDDFARSIIEAHAKHQIGNKNSEGAQIDVRQARRYDAVGRKARLR